MIQLEDIYKKYPFIYEVEGNLYQFGSGAFKEGVSKQGEQYYSLYKEELNRIGRDNIRPHELEAMDVKTLVYAFRKIKSYCDCENQNTDYNESKHNLLGYIENLSADAKNDLLQQIEDYVHVFWYYNRYTSQLIK